jgi:hypothetical protein
MQRHLRFYQLLYDRCLSETSSSSRIVAQVYPTPWRHRSSRPCRPMQMQGRPSFRASCAAENKAVCVVLQPLHHSRGQERTRCMAVAKPPLVRNSRHAEQKPTQSRRKNSFNIPLLSALRGSFYMGSAYTGPRLAAIEHTNE